MSIAENLTKIKSSLPQNVTLIAVTKTKPLEDLMEAYNNNHKIFGENKVQEMTTKYEQLPKDIQWHLIGHLQTNKVKYIADFVHMIHSVDSEKLADEINKQAIKKGRKINCLMQMYIAKEDTKFGFDENELNSFIQSNPIEKYQGINWCGVMGMATFTDNTIQIKNEFANLKKIFNDLKSGYFAYNTDFKEISMGMSDDYKLAIEEGSTMIRVGSAIFGSRNYNI